MNSLSELCSITNKNRKKKGHRLALPHFEETHKYYNNGEHVFFINNQLPKDKKQDGWKFHILVASEYLECTWTLIHSRLLEDQTGSFAFKIIDITKAYEDNGTQITLYTFRDQTDRLIQSEDVLFNILRDIEKILRLNSIPPGNQSPTDRKLPGSRYIAMRNDLVPETGEYLSHEQALQHSPEPAFNPFKQFNPYDSFSMTHPTQRFFYPLFPWIFKEENYFSNVRANQTTNAPPDLYKKFGV